MKLRSLNLFEFDEFSLNHPLGSYHQSSSYALFMSEQDYDYDLLGIVDDDDNIIAASLVLIKRIGLFNRYAYAPKGFLIDYNNKSLLKFFTDSLKKYYYKKNVAFIKVNPEIIIGNIDYKNKKIIYNENQIIINNLCDLNFNKLEGRLFEYKIPKFNAILDLKKTNLNTVSKNTRNKIKKGINSGMNLVKGTREDIEILYKFIKNKKEYNIEHYYNYYNAFSRNDAIDIFLVEIDFETCLINLRNKYAQEYNKNNELVNELMNHNTEENLIKKMVSDHILNSYDDSMIIATNYLSQGKKKYIAGAITIKFRDKVYILISGFDQEFKKFCPNYFLHYQLMEYYKDNYNYLDLNGMTGDFDENNPYKGLDEFKVGFKPDIYEYIGEFDFIVNDGLYKSMNRSGQLAKEFTKKQKSND